MKKRHIFILLLACMALLQCAKREWDNPWDEKAGIDPADWAPQNLQIKIISNTKIKLTWEYNGDDRIEGFKLDRKMGEEPWLEAYKTFSKDAREWDDENVTTDQGSEYSYRLYAFVNDMNSQAIMRFFLAFTDIRDGTIYNAINIGAQCWMNENLAYLPEVSPPGSGSITTAFYYVYGYQGSSVSEAKATSSYQTYGVLYNWPAAMAACPAGWHLPSDSEWNVLINHLGGSDVAGGKMKTAGTTHWNSPNYGATNESGFSALPGGSYYSGTYYFMGYFGYWWSATEYSSTLAWYRGMYYDNGSVLRGSNYETYGHSVRCVRD